MALGVKKLDWTRLPNTKENDVHGPNFPHPPPDLIEGQEEWEIERIIRHKKQRGHQGTWQTEYQVKWKGYEDMTWEPEENLENAQDIIADYWTRQKKLKIRIPPTS